jgi:hypothetical protein
LSVALAEALEDASPAVPAAPVVCAVSRGAVVVGFELPVPAAELLIPVGAALEPGAKFPDADDEEPKSDEPNEMLVAEGAAAVAAVRATALPAEQVGSPLPTQTWTP